MVLSGIDLKLKNKENLPDFKFNIDFNLPTFFIYAVFKGIFNE
jgi:hypothetical protein